MTGTSANSTGSRCVLWHAVGASLPADLVLSLERRGVEISTCDNAYAAVARACTLERENDERTDDPGQRDSLVLVLVSPRDLCGRAEVVDAMRRYAPRTACWWYDPSANPRLRAVVDEDVDQWLAEGVRTGQPAVIRPRSGEEPRPRLKLSGEGEDGQAGADPSAAGRLESNTGDVAGGPHTRMEGLRHGTGGATAS